MEVSLHGVGEAEIRARCVLLATELVDDRPQIDGLVDSHRDAVRLTGELIKLRGEETARLFQESQEAAVDRIEAIVQAHGIACNFRRLDGYLFPALHMKPDEAREASRQGIRRGAQSRRRRRPRQGTPLQGSPGYARHPLCPPGNVSSAEILEGTRGRHSKVTAAGCSRTAR